MKLVKIALMTIALASMSLATTACSNQAAATDTEAEQGKEYTSAYICPMHCAGSGSAEMGQCPVCGMDYVANENNQSEAAPQDDHNHEGHDHSHDGHDHDHQH